MNVNHNNFPMVEVNIILVNNLNLTKPRVKVDLEWTSFCEVKNSKESIWPKKLNQSLRYFEPNACMAE